jgi:hypothetical protein
MTEQSFQQIYRELVLLLSEHNLGWVVDQAASIDSQVAINDSSVSFPTEISTTQALLTKPTIQTAQAKLVHLIDAAERIVIDTTDMEGALVNFLGETGDRLNAPLTLGFAGDDSDIEPLTGSPDRYQAIAELRQFLKTLRQEVVSGVD